MRGSRHLFDAYITAMFGRRTTEASYTRQQTTQCLSWLAGQMVAHNQTLFYIEQMQPDWLPYRQQRAYTFRVRLLSGLGVGMGVALVGGLLGGLLGGPVFGPLVGLIGGLVGGLLGGLIADELSAWLFERQRGWSWNRILVAETIHWDWSSIWEWLAGLLLVGIIIGRYVVGWVGGLLAGLVSGLLVGLFVELRRATIEPREEIGTTMTPNQGIRRSARAALHFGLGVGLRVGLAFVLGGELGVGIHGGLTSGLVSGLVAGLVSGLAYGGRTVLQHYMLRWLLYRNGSLPLRLVPFLGYCVDRIFLRRVGGGYIFVHRLLLEHFAGLEQGTAE